MPPLLPRALRHLGESFSEEADSGITQCRVVNRDERLVEACGLVAFFRARDRLEYHVKSGNAPRVAWALRWGGADVRISFPRGAWAPPRWRLALFAAPPAPGEWFFEAKRADWPLWPVPAAHAAARAALLAGPSGAPHGGFVMPPQMWAPPQQDEWGFGPRIEGPLAAWRAARPGALVANVVGRRDLVDADFAHFAGVRALFMWGCDNPGLTGAALAHLRGVHTLWLPGCSQASLGDAAFAHLRGVHTLDMSGCTQATLTDGAFAHLRGVHTLDMGRCTQPAVTGAALLHLRGIRVLRMGGCKPAVVAAARALRLPLVAVA